MSTVVFFGKRIPTKKTLWMALQSVKGLGPTLSLQVRPRVATAPIPSPSPREAPPPRTHPQVCETLGFSRLVKMEDVSAAGTCNFYF